MITLEEKLASLPPERQKHIRELTQEMIAQEMTLRSLRKARRMTQVSLAKRMHIGQESVSRIENRTDLHLSTLNKYVEGIGGKLRLVAEFPGSPPVTIRSLAALGDRVIEQDGVAPTQGDSKHPQGFGLEAPKRSIKRNRRRRRLTFRRR